MYGCVIIVTFVGYSCPVGSSSPNATSHLCPLGQYCPDGGLSDVNCPAGTYGNHTGGVDESSTCSPCPAGYFCPEGTAGYPGELLHCPQGHYCPEGTTTAFENPCSDGSYSTMVGLERDNQCLQCPAGRYCHGGDGIGGQVCPSGHYCPASSSQPTPCPAGLFTEETGAVEVTNCHMCPAGYYCLEGADSPMPCPTGTFNPLLGQESLNCCQLCRAGMACSEIALTQPNELCAAGYYCPAGSYKANDPDHACPAGTYTHFHNLTSPRECTICPPGEVCPEGTGGIQSPMLKCAPGHFCPNGTQFATQYPCAAGSYSNATNLQRQEDCTLCPAGYYCVGGESAPTAPCSRGHYCPEGTKTATEFPCYAGTYYNQTGNIRVQNCIECFAGHYCPQGSAEPTPCPSGTFSRSVGAGSMMTCEVCYAGYYCPGEGNIDPLACGRSQYSDVGQDSCSSCLAGHYCDNMTTSLEDMRENKVCPAGTVCASGRSHAPNLLVDFCPAGFYCLAGNVVCVLMHTQYSAHIHTCIKLMHYNDIHTI